jgi:uncharacterized membrane protein required for colicin V production
MAGKTVIALVSAIVALVSISPLIPALMESAELGGDYIAKNSYRDLSPELRQQIYSSVSELNNSVNGVVLVALIFAALFVVLLTVIEYYKFYKIYKLHESGEEK